VKQHTHQIHIATHGKGLYEFTREIHICFTANKRKTGLLTVFCQHTSASLVIQENADPDVVAICRFSSRALSPKTRTCTGTR